MLKRIVSFGFKHNVTPPRGAVVVDVRQMFRNPYTHAELRDRTGRDPEVQKMVLSTPNFDAKYRHVRDLVTSPGTEEAWIGCQGGRHRSVFLAERLGAELGVPVEHWNLPL